MAVSGSQKTRIGGSISGVGIKLTITAKSPASVTGGPFPFYTRRRLSGGFIHHGLMMPCL